MANQPYTVTMPDVQCGPAFVWPLLLAPADGSRMLVDTNGNPTNPAATTWAATTAYSLGQNVWDGTNIQICVIAGTSGGTAPAWSTSPYPANLRASALTTDNTVTWICMGTPYSIGGTEGAAEFTVDTKIDDVMIDQNPAIVDAIMTAEAASISVSLKESSLRKVFYAMPGALYTSGTDTGLPANAQNYEQLDYGGLTLPSTLAPSVGFCMGIISPRRGYTSPGKFNIAVLYNAFSKGPLKIGYTRSKEAIYKVDFVGMANIWRTSGKQLCQYFRQT